jgi:NAD(P)-dependent dehydrogenase (short-subunit alcohol dehydrogenase family)
MVGSYDEMERSVSSSLSGKKAVVTGASRGIGRAIAERFAAEGASVGILARNGEMLAEVADGIEQAGGSCVSATTDVTVPEEFRGTLDAVVSQLGGADILVNNAGGNSFSMPLVATRFSGWEKTMKLNLDSVVHACQVVLPGMLSQTSGSVINMSSVVALRGGPLMAHYAAAKAALVSLTQSLAVECASSGVRVNVLLPGWIDTDLTDFLRVDNTTEEAVLSRVPMQRWGTAAEIASAAVFLAGDQSSFVTGQSLIVDGGLSAMP